ncbi:MAG: Protocatechuate 3,4-dioxygenase alpha chain [Nocardioidaceae bacterium]|nr:Protocatechuate 3,4-dioxygenase alpha chain [Nocardioidaceae bacterium]
MSTPPTPGQTIGPFFGYSLPYDGGPDLVPLGRAGAVRLHGRVLDGAGEPVPDALVELWQTDPSGAVVQQPGSLHRDGWTFTGWGRAASDATGHYSFTTLLPGGPFFALTVFARGLTHRLFTRAYIADDPFLDTVAADRRHTLRAAPEDGGFGFDIRLQGEDETVFLRFPRH